MPERHQPLRPLSFVSGGCRWLQLSAQQSLCEDLPSAVELQSSRASTSLASPESQSQPSNATINVQKRTQTGIKGWGLRPCGLLDLCGFSYHTSNVVVSSGANVILRMFHHESTAALCFISPASSPMVNSIDATSVFCFRLFPGEACTASELSNRAWLRPWRLHFFERTMTWTRTEPGRIPANLATLVPEALVSLQAQSSRSSEVSCKTSYK